MSRFLSNNPIRSATLYSLIPNCKKSAAWAIVLSVFNFWQIAPVSAAQSEAAQKQTLYAIQMVEKNSWSQAKNAVTQTQDPLAAKLYYWMVYVRSNNDNNFVKITQFIRQNPHWPGMRDLRIKAEKNVPADLAPRDIIAWFDDYEPITADGLDAYLSAILKTGNVDKARQYLSKWWAGTPLQRDDQKTLFRKYNRYINTAAHHKRLDMLLFKGQTSNALAIADVLQQGYPQLALARIALAEDKDNVDALVAAVPKNLQNDAGLLYERLRWRRRNDLNDAAIQVLKMAPPISQIQNPADWWLERHIIIRRYLEQKRYKEAYQLAASHRQVDGLPFAQAEWMAGWLALRFLNNPKQAFKHFNNLYLNVSSPISKSRGAYWAGRASHAAGQADIGDKWYQVAAQFRTAYYGQLAAAEINLAGDISSAAPPKLTPADISAFNSDELVQVARLFHFAGMRQTASNFIMAFVDAHDENAKAHLFAAELASELGRYYDAVKIAKDATNKGLFLTAQAYPVIADKLRGIDTEWALVHGLIRQESVFDFEARSPAGALGLMQLMPATAAETARKLGIQHSNIWLTSKPEHNIRLGTTYLQQMLDRYQGAYPMAIAAYNAGPGRVDKWLQIYGDPRNGDIDIVDWIELIPIYETRNYVQRVVEATYIYRMRLKGAQGKDPPRAGLAMPRNLRQL